MAEKQLEFNLKGISNKDEHDKYMEEISDDARNKIKKVLDKVIKKKKYDKKDINDIVGLGKWIGEQR